ncbi:hypothetical protein [Biostraticola tofi]|uniref:Uncharacterized protein n=1 Tax=Biostraticola tofi TaxID=466109 RepID=A0A4R3Z286_9GAMM|nr:hypothetical protein [Biostraticola tofi]TCV97933.1 hypothetical protein EDC52_1037 [Biostraticola tofi]
MLKILFLFISMTSISSFSIANPMLSDNEVKTEIIREYLKRHITYTGPCPCPEIKAADGSQCGTRSAWSRKPGTGVMCYLDEVKPGMVDVWRVKNTNQKALPQRIMTAKNIKIDNKIDEYLKNYVINKITNPDDLNFKGLKIVDTKKIE